MEIMSASQATKTAFSHELFKYNDISMEIQMYAFNAVNMCTKMHILHISATVTQIRVSLNKSQPSVSVPGQGVNFK